MGTLSVICLQCNVDLRKFIVHPHPRSCSLFLSCSLSFYLSVSLSLSPSIYISLCLSFSVYLFLFLLSLSFILSHCSSHLTKNMVAEGGGVGAGPRQRGGEGGGAGTSQRGGVFVVYNTERYILTAYSQIRCCHCFDGNGFG